MNPLVAPEALRHEGRCAGLVQQQRQAAGLGGGVEGELVLDGEQLAQQGFVAPTRLDTDRLALQAAEKDTDAAVQDQQVARADLAQARAALDVVQRPGSAPSGKASASSTPAVAALPPLAPRARRRSIARLRARLTNQVIGLAFSASNLSALFQTVRYTS